jgi:DNA-binding HxlR family transcriptional regulator
LSDPYAAQKKTKAESQRRILEALRDSPAKFGELHARAKVSATILAKHLKELQARGLVTQRVADGEVLYESTEKAKKAEQAARTVMLIGLQKMKSLPQDEESLSVLASIMSLAKEKPEYFETIVDWLGQLMDFVVSSGRVDWLQSQQARRSFQEAINARVQKPTGQISTPAELREALDKFLEVIREVVMTETGGKK